MLYQGERTYSYDVPRNCSWHFGEEKRLLANDQNILLKSKLRYSLDVIYDLEIEM